MDANLVFYCYNAIMKIALKLSKMIWSHQIFQRMFSPDSKTYKFIMGQKNIIETIKAEMQNNTKEVYWFHASSYGEYAVARPIVKQIRSLNKCIVVTFFSSSGYEALIQENSYKHEVDHIFFLPVDTLGNAKKFLDIVNPQRAIFIISEYWIDYLKELKKRDIPTYIISMHVTKKSYLLKWYGFPLRKALKAIKTFVVLDEESKRNLSSIGYNNVVVAGNPLFDNAVGISKEPYSNSIIENFCSTAKSVFVGGSIDNDKDLLLVSSLANQNKDVKFIIAPHEISEEKLNSIQYEMEGLTKLYSECSAKTDFSNTQTLVIDFMGYLSRIYRYGKWAYVGGGFTPYLHSVIEPVVYGMPVAFGPQIDRKETPSQMVELGIGSVVRNKKEIKEWFVKLKDDESHLEDIREKTKAFVNSNTNAAQYVVKILLS